MDGAALRPRSLPDSSTPRSPSIGDSPSVRATVPSVSGPQLEIVLPVYNEAQILQRSLERLLAFLAEAFPLTWRITIADNGSTDETFDIATQLAEANAKVCAVRITEKGRGRALRSCWQNSDAAVVAYMDIDLSTDLAALYPLVAPILAGEADLSIGTRLDADSTVNRGWKRELISRSYNRIVRAALGTSFSDAQCGFKAVRSDVARELLPAVADNGWFFDTEMLVLADRLRYRIWEVPVEWTDDPDSRVRVVGTARDDLWGIARILWESGRVRSLGMSALARKLFPSAAIGAHR